MSDRRVGFVWRYLPIAALIGGGVLCARSSQAESGFGLARFDPSEPGSRWFRVDSLDIAGNNRWALGVVGDFAHDPLVLRDATGAEIAPVVADQFFLHLGAAVTLVDRLRFGLNLPILAFQNASAALGPNGRVSPSEGAGIGDVRVSVDLRVVGYAKEPIAVSVGVRTYFPTGKRSAFTSDGVFNALLRTQVAGQLGALVYSAEAGVRARGREQNFGGEPVGSELVLAGGLGVTGFNQRFVVGPEVWASTVFSDGAEAFLGHSSTPVELTLGGHFEVVKSFKLGLGIGPGLSAGMGSPLIRYLFKLEWAPRARPVETTPSPLPPDRDRDGISDRADRCPDVPGPWSAEPGMDDGCPLPADTDADGIPDPRDACPLERGPVNREDARKHGCPLPPDADADGILDADDACPLERGVVDLQDHGRHGCPLPADSDGDGIRDLVDACPTLPGLPNDAQRKNGCPKVIVTQSQIQILDRVEFESARATLRAESSEILRAVVNVLEANPGIRKLSIEGHTDNRGGAAFNLELSRQRAATVLAWLVANGIDADRLTSTGFGVEQPIDSNETEAGRQNNRRVEFEILDRSTETLPAR